jgi:hypothetical protein
MLRLPGTTALGIGRAAFGRSIAHRMRAHIPKSLPTHGRAQPERRIVRKPLIWQGSEAERPPAEPPQAFRELLRGHRERVEARRRSASFEPVGTRPHAPPAEERFGEWHRGEVSIRSEVIEDLPDRKDQGAAGSRDDQAQGMRPQGEGIPEQPLKREADLALRSELLEDKPPEDEPRARPPVGADEGKAAQASSGTNLDPPSQPLPVARPPHSDSPPGPRPVQRREQRGGSPTPNALVTNQEASDQHDPEPDSNGPINMHSEPREEAAESTARPRAMGAEEVPGKAVHDRGMGEEPRIEGGERPGPHFRSSPDMGKREKASRPSSARSSARPAQPNAVKSQRPPVIQRQGLEFAARRRAVGPAKPEPEAQQAGGQPFDRQGDLAVPPGSEGADKTAPTLGRPIRQTLTRRIVQRIPVWKESATPSGVSRRVAEAADGSPLPSGRDQTAYRTDPPRDEPERQISRSEPAVHHQMHTAIPQVRREVYLEREPQQPIQRQAQETSAHAEAGSGTTKPEVDVQAVAREVYKILKHKLRVEQERTRGWGGY